MLELEFKYYGLPFPSSSSIPHLGAEPANPKKPISISRKKSNVPADSGSTTNLYALLKEKERLLDELELTVRDEQAATSGELKMVAEMNERTAQKVG